MLLFNTLQIADCLFLALLGMYQLEFFSTFYAQIQKGHGI
jgi:hypothetical protein